MADLQPTSSLALDDKENPSQPSAGKRAREDTDPFSKRRALAPLSNQLGNVQERRQKFKEPFTVSDATTDDKYLYVLFDMYSLSSHTRTQAQLCSSTTNFAGVQATGPNSASLCLPYCGLGTPGEPGKHGRLNLTIPSASDHTPHLLSFSLSTLFTPHSSPSTLLTLHPPHSSPRLHLREVGAFPP